MFHIMTATSSLPRAKPTGIQIALWACSMLLLLVLSLYDWNGYQVGTYGDDASYIANTDSLLQGTPYGLLLTPGEDRATQFPFVLPLLLVPFRVLFPASLDAMRLVPLVSTLLALGVLFWGWHRIGRGLSYWWAVAVVAVTALSPITILHARTIMSEAPFLLFMLLTMFWVEKVIDARPRAWGVVLGILLVCVMFTRTIGWVFAGLWLLYLGWKLRREIVPQLAVALATGGALLALMLALTSVHPVDLLPQEYIAQYTNSLTPATVRTTKKVEIPVGVSQRTYPEYLAFAVLVHLDIADKLPFTMERAVIQWTNERHLTFLRLIPGLAGVLLLGLGLAAWWRKTGMTAFQIIVPPYLILLSLWTWNGPRLFYPIQPQLLFAFLFGVFVSANWLVSRLPFERVKRWFAPGLVGAIALFILAVSVYLDLNTSRTMLLPGDQIARAAHIIAAVPTGATLLSTRAPTDHLYVPRTIIDIPARVASTYDLADYLRRHHVDYIAGTYGIESSPENMRLRIGQVNRFVAAAQPLVDLGILEIRYLDEPGDFAIYYVHQDQLDTVVP